MKNNQDYYDLKKSVSGYISKYPPSNRKKNKIWLKRLYELKPFIAIDPEKAKEYYTIRDTIALSNGGFAMKYVMRYSSLLTDDVSISELFQEATIGIIESIDTFNAKKNTSFTTYAFFHIRKRIIDFIKRNKLIRAPRDIARNMKHVNEIQSLIQVSKCIIPTAKEIQKVLKKQGILLKEALIDNILILLDLSSGSGESFITEYKDQITTPEDSDLFKNMEMHLMSSIAGYSDTIQKAIMLRYGIGREFPHAPEEVRMMLKLKDKDLKVLDDNRQFTN